MKNQTKEKHIRMNITFKPYNYTLNDHILRSKDLLFFLHLEVVWISILYAYNSPLPYMHSIVYYDFFGVFIIKCLKNWLKNHNFCWVLPYSIKHCCCFHIVFTSMKVSLLSF
jgi:hypothetical protein